MGTVEPIRVHAIRRVQEYPLLRSELTSITQYAGMGIVTSAFAVLLICLGAGAFMALPGKDMFVGLYAIIGGIIAAVASFRMWWALHKLVNRVIAETEPAVRGVNN